MVRDDDPPIDSEKAAACWESHRPQWYLLEKLDSTQSPEMEDPASLRKYYQPLRREAMRGSW
jgi:hypothetical protein